MFKLLLIICRMVKICNFAPEFTNWVVSLYANGDTLTSLLLIGFYVDASVVVFFEYYLNNYDFQIDEKTLIDNTLDKGILESLNVEDQDKIKKEVLERERQKRIQDVGTYSTGVLWFFSSIFLILVINPS